MTEGVLDELGMTEGVLDELGMTEGVLDELGMTEGVLDELGATGRARYPRWSRPCVEVRSSSGPIGTIFVGLMSSCVM